MINYDSQNRLKIIFSLYGTVLPRILSYVVVMVIWSLIVFAIIHFGKFDLNLSAQAHAIVGVALGLLLVFRTNTAYDRFWTGRALLGALGISARNLAIKSSVVIPEIEKTLRNEISVLISTFVLGIKAHLREEALEENIKALPENLQEELKVYSSPLNGILILLSKRLHGFIDKQWVQSAEYSIYAKDIDELQQEFRGLDRVRFTPLPFAYVNQLKVFMLIYFLTLPVVFIPAFGWGVIFAMAFVVYALVGIEEIGVEIEDPFGDDPNDLPIEKICNGIQKDVTETLSCH